MHIVAKQRANAGLYEYEYDNEYDNVNEYGCGGIILRTPARDGKVAVTALRCPVGGCESLRCFPAAVAAFFLSRRGLLFPRFFIPLSLSPFPVILKIFIKIVCGKFGL